MLIPEQVHWQFKGLGVEVIPSTLMMLAVLGQSLTSPTAPTEGLGDITVAIVRMLE